MTQYAAKKRNCHTTLRCTDEVMNYINTWPQGESFADKLESIVLLCCRDESQKRETINRLNKDIEKLELERSELLQDIGNLKHAQVLVNQASKNLYRLNALYAGEIDDKRMRAIAGMLKEGGFVPTESVVEGIYKLDLMMEHRHNLKEISEIAKKEVYSAVNKDAQAEAEIIAAQLREQELEHAEEQIIME